MARGINKVILVGNLGQDPDTKAMPSGMTVCNLRIATSESWKDKQSGEMKEQTEWHSVAMFGRLAEIAGEYLKKGSQVYIEGRLRTRKWQDKQGNDRYTTETSPTRCRCSAAVAAAVAVWAAAAAVPPTRAVASRCAAAPKKTTSTTTSRSDACRDAISSSLSAVR